MAREWDIASDLTAARGLVAEVLADVEARRYSDDACFAIRLALEEALINAIKHGNRFDPAKRIRVSAEIGERQTAITVADEGKGFDPGDVPDPTVDENLEKPCGRGIMLMRAYMDEVAYGPGGNHVRIVKHRS